MNGTSTSYTATADADGKVTFNIPAVPTGSTVTVKMDVRDSSGILVQTGKTSKTVTDSDSSLAVTLIDKLDVQLLVPSGVNYYVYRVSSDGGTTWDYNKAAGTDEISAKLGDNVTVQGFALVTAEKAIYKFSAGSFTAAEGVSLQLELDTSQKMDADSPGVYYDPAPGNSISYSLSYIDQLLDFQNEGLFSFEPLSYSYTTDGSTWLTATLDTSSSWTWGTVSITLNAGNQIQMVSKVTLGDGSVEWQTVCTIQ
ncbi:MAG: hypothetical protein IJU95_03205 [Treponema sp.]|nr:hypothetical protein [Treponema sp.]